MNDPIVNLQGQPPQPVVLTDVTGTAITIPDNTFDTYQIRSIQEKLLLSNKLQELQLIVINERYSSNNDWEIR
jgi:hypothetical protein